VILCVNRKVSKKDSKRKAAVTGTIAKIAEQRKEKEEVGCRKVRGGTKAEEGEVVGEK